MSKKKTIAQQAGYLRSSMKRKGTQTLIDNFGREVPIEYIPDLDLVKHFHAQEMIDEANAIKKHMQEFKARCQKIGDELYDQLMEENQIKPSSKGGFTLPTFDKQVHVLFRMDTVKEKNHEHITLAGEYWNKFMQDEYPDRDPKEHFLHNVVNEIVFNTKDEVDTGLINMMNRYSAKIKNKYFKKFLEHLNQAFDLRYTKRFEVFEEKNKQGKYKGVILSYSKLEPLEA